MSKFGKPAPTKPGANQPAPKPAPKPVIPKAPPMPANKPNATQRASGALNFSDTAGGHNRTEHVGKTGQQLINRNKKVATSFMTPHDQNKAAATVMNTNAFGATNNKVAQGKMHGKQAVTTNTNVKNIGARTAPLVKVAEKQPDGSTKVFNAKVTQTTMVVKKGPGSNRAQTTFAEKYTALPKPSPGPSLKPTTKANVTSIANGASGLRKVGAPAPKPLDMGNQKRFKGVTKNAK